MKRRPRAFVGRSVLLLIMALGVVPAGAGAACPNEAIRVEQDSGALPDCRAYELISTPDKNLADIARVPTVSEDGNTVVYGGWGGESGAVGKDVISFSLARRTTGGWTHQNANPQETGTLPENWFPIGFNADYSRAAFITSAILSPEDENAAEDLYEVALSSGASKLLTAMGPVPKTESAGVTPLGVSGGISHLLFEYQGESPFPGVPAGSFTVNQLSEGALRLESILPDETVASEGRAAVPLGARSGTDAHPLAIQPPDSPAHSISEDGTRVFWRNGNIKPAPLYVRIDGTTTQAVSRSQTSEDSATVAPAQFIAATKDGSVAYFLSSAHLTNDAPSAEGEYQTLYRYDVGTDSLSAVTPGPGRAGVDDAVLSDDGSRLYFIATGVLAPGATAEEANVYVTDTQTGAIRFIATVNPHPFSHSPETVSQTDYIARVSQNGAWALIASSRALDGAATGGHEGLYLYGDATGSLSCVSCRADGTPNEGEPSLTGDPEGAFPSNVGGWRDLTDEGTVFFNSTDRLLPQDLTAAQDVYEYHQGTLSLISSGRSSLPSFVMENTEDGSSVYFLTRSRLLPADPDTLLDLYAARVGGGFAEAALSATASCEGDGCQGGGSVPQAAPSAASAALRGGGNIRGDGRRCMVVRHRARGAKHTARRLRRNARRAGAAHRARHLRHKARRLEKRAKRLHRAGQRCAQGASGASTRARRAGR